MQHGNPIRNRSGEMVGARSALQLERDARFFQLARGVIEQSGENWASHSLAVTKRTAIARVLYLHELYRRIVDVPGVICEFGVHWGASMATLINLRSMLEPFNTSRTVHGFDTFLGFSVVSPEDGAANRGDYATPEDYERTLEEILAYHESIGPFGDRRRFELVRGDVSVTVPTWLESNPHALVAMAIFDMDVYTPTRDVLQIIRPRMAKGALLVFDELNCPFFPGETQAVLKALELSTVRLERHPLQPYCAWAVV